jgi:predicted permease
VSRLSTLLAKARGLPWGARADREFAQEVEDHLDRLAERFVREGMTPGEARHAALRQFGNITSVRERRTEMRSFAPLQALARDLRQGARLLRRNPGWTAVAVFTLALGIGANAAIFGLVRPILLEPLPYPDPDRLVVPCTIFQRMNSDRGAVSFADILDWKAMPDLFETVAAYNPSTADITDGEEPERVQSVIAEPTYFEVLGTTPELGRFFTAEENLPNGPPVAVLSHALWLRRYGGDPHVVGKRIELRGVSTTVVGVTRPDATWPADAELFQPLGTGGQPDANMLRRDNHVYQSLARLKRGVPVARAQAKLTVVGDQVARRDTNRAGTNWKLHPLAAYIVGPTLQQTLTILLGAALVVLLIVCVNVVNLLLARGVSREPEVAVRAALGAGRGRIAAQFLVESALLAAAGGAGGLVVGYWGLKALVRFAPPNVPRIEHAHIDLSVLVFSIGLCAVTTVLAGLAPASQAARVRPAQAFHGTGRGVAGGLGARRLRGALVVAEIALAVVLLTGAGLLIRSYGRITSVDPGISSRGLLTMRISLPRARYAGPPQIAEGYDRLAEAVGRVPGVSRASAVSSLPLGGGGSYLGRSFLREGQAEPPVTTDAHGAWSIVRPDYFSTVGIPILEGRAFTPDDRATSTPVIVISRSMAKEMFPDGHALGKRVRSWRDENLYREIVGVVGDVRYSGLTDAIGNNVYVPHTQNSWRSLTLVVRSQVPPEMLLRSVRAAIWSVDRKLPVSEVQTLEDVVNRNIASPRFSMFLLVIFGMIAVVLAAVGIYGVMAYAVTQRTREIGIRMALGALRTGVVGMVTWNAFRLAATGVAIGLTAAFGVTRVFSSLLFEVEPTDTATFTVASALLLVVAMLAASVPAARAARIDPVTTLRYE